MRCVDREACVLTRCLGVMDLREFSGNIILHPCFDAIRNTDAYRVVGDLANTDFIMRNSFWVGVYPGMTDDKIDYIGKCIIEACAPGR